MIWILNLEADFNLTAEEASAQSVNLLTRSPRRAKIYTHGRITDDEFTNLYKQIVEVEEQGAQDCSTVTTEICTTGAIPPPDYQVEWSWASAFAPYQAGESITWRIVRVDGFGLNARQSTPVDHTESNDDYDETLEPVEGRVFVVRFDRRTDEPAPARYKIYRQDAITRGIDDAASRTRRYYLVGEYTDFQIFYQDRIPFSFWTGDLSGIEYWDQSREGPYRIHCYDQEVQSDPLNCLIGLPGAPGGIGKDAKHSSLRVIQKYFGTPGLTFDIRGQFSTTGVSGVDTGWANFWDFSFVDPSSDPWPRGNYINAMWQNWWDVRQDYIRADFCIITEFRSYPIATIPRPCIVWGAYFQLLQPFDPITAIDCYVMLFLTEPGIIPEPPDPLDPLRGPFAYTGKKIPVMWNAQAGDPPAYNTYRIDRGERMWPRYWDQYGVEHNADYLDWHPDWDFDRVDPDAAFPTGRKWFDARSTLALGGTPSPTSLNWGWAWGGPYVYPNGAEIWFKSKAGFDSLDVPSASGPYGPNYSSRPFGGGCIGCTIVYEELT